MHNLREKVKSFSFTQTWRDEKSCFACKWNCISYWFCLNAWEKVFSTCKSRIENNSNLLACLLSIFRTQIVFLLYSTKVWIFRLIVSIPVRAVYLFFLRFSLYHLLLSLLSCQSSFAFFFLSAVLTRSNANNLIIYISQSDTNSFPLSCQLLSLICSISFSREFTWSQIKD